MRTNVELKIVVFAYETGESFDNRTQRMWNGQLIRIRDNGMGQSFVKRFFPIAVCEQRRREFFGKCGVVQQNTGAEQIFFLSVFNHTDNKTADLRPHPFSRDSVTVLFYHCFLGQASKLQKRGAFFTYCTKNCRYSPISDRNRSEEHTSELQSQR